MGHHEMSERQACKAMGFCRMTIRIEDLTVGADGERVVSLLQNELADAAVLAMGTGEGQGSLFTHILRLLPGLDQADGLR